MVRRGWAAIRVARQDLDVTEAFGKDEHRVYSGRTTVALEPFDWKPERQLVADLLEKLGIPIAPLAKYFEAVRERRLNRATALLEEAAAEADSDVAGLLDAYADDRLGDLLVAALEAAVVARTSENVTALARVLAKSMRDPDDATIDHSHHVVRVVRELEPVDIIALHALEEVGPRPYGTDLPRPYDILRQQMKSDVLVAPIEEKLLRLALINPGSKFEGDELWHLVTAFGRAVLTYLGERTD